MHTLLRRGWAILVGSAILWIGLELPALAQDSKTTDGLTVYLGVVPAEMVKGPPAHSGEPPIHGGTPRHGHQYHVVAAIFDAATNVPAALPANVLLHLPGRGLRSHNRRSRPYDKMKARLVRQGVSSQHRVSTVSMTFAAKPFCWRCRTHPEQQPQFRSLWTVTSVSSAARVTEIGDSTIVSNARTDRRVRSGMIATIVLPRLEFDLDQWHLGVSSTNFHKFRRSQQGGDNLTLRLGRPIYFGV